MFIKPQSTPRRPSPPADVSELIVSGEEGERVREGRREKEGEKGEREEEGERCSVPHVERQDEDRAPGRRGRGVCVGGGEEGRSSAPSAAVVA